MHFLPLNLDSLTPELVWEIFLRNVQYVTMPVDFEEVKPRYWFTPKIKQHYFNGTDRLYQQAKSAGIPDEFNHRISGMIIDPESL